MSIVGAIVVIVIGFGIRKIGLENIGSFTIGIGIIGLIIMLTQCGK